MSCGAGGPLGPRLMLRQCRARALPGVEVRWRGQARPWTDRERQTRDRLETKEGRRSACAKPRGTRAKRFELDVVHDGVARKNRRHRPGRRDHASRPSWPVSLGRKPAPVRYGARQAVLRLEECRRRSTARRRSGVAGIQYDHACTASAHGHIRSAIGSAPDRNQRLVARWGRRIGGLRRDGAGVFNETNSDGAARDLDATGRSEPVSVTTGGSPFSVKRSGTGIAVSPQGSASMPSARASTNV